MFAGSKAVTEEKTWLLQKIYGITVIYEQN